MWSELVDLAKEPSSERRRELLSRVADAFLNDSVEYSDRELVMLCDVLMQLLDQVEVEARAALAVNVAESDRATEGLHRRLADDEIRVAEPVLMHSVKLGDATLVELASRQSQKHLLAISRRPSLSTAVTDALVARGEDEVLVSLSDNPGADISPAGFDRLGARASDCANLQMSLARRDDLPNGLARRLMTMLPPQARLQLMHVTKTTGSAHDVLAAASSKLAEQKLARRHQRLETKALIADIRAGTAKLDSVLTKLAEEDRLVDLALALAEFASLKESVTSQCLFRVNVEPLALLLRSLEITETTVDAIAGSWCRRLQLPGSMREKLVASWSGVDRTVAGRAVRFTQLRAAT